MALSSITNASMRLSRGKRPQAAVGAGHRQVSEQRLGACVQGRVTVAAGFLRQDASHRVLAYTGWFQHKYVLGVVRPTPILGPARGSRSCPGHVRRGNRSLREKRWREACCLAAVRVPDSHASSTVDLPAGPSASKAQLTSRRVLFLRLQRLRHTVEPHGRVAQV
jgi:hypothetical protein